MTTPRPAGRAALRDATHSIHEQLHQAPAFLALARGDLTVKSYASLLSKLATCYFSAAEHVAIDPERLRLLRHDLAAVKGAVPAAAGWSAPEPGSETLGWRYAVEGSMFGGRVIYRQLDYLFGETAEGRTFFRGTADGPKQWQSLCAELDRAGKDPGQLSGMIDGAVRAFAAFGRVLGAKEAVHA